MPLRGLFRPISSLLRSTRYPRDPAAISLLFLALFAKVLDANSEPPAKRNLGLALQYLILVDYVCLEDFVEVYYIGHFFFFG